MVQSLPHRLDLNMKLNLKSFNIQKLSFSTTCVIPRKILSNIKKQDKAVGSVSRFFDSYTIDRVSHLIVLTLQCKDAKKSEYFVEFEYSIKRRKIKLYKDTPKINNLIDKLCTLDKSQEFTCSTHLEYNKKDNRQFIIDLPIKISRNSILPISLIDGFSIEGNVESIDYSALIYTTAKQAYSLTIIFFNNYHIDSLLIQYIIDDANKIINSIMPPSKSVTMKK